jgi:phosphate transport system permease protein
MNRQIQLVIAKTNMQAEGRPGRPSVVARNQQNRLAQSSFFIVTLLPMILIAVVTIILIVRSWPILSAYPPMDLFLGSTWKPDSGLFGFWPYIMGTFWVTLVGVLLAVPPCLLTALYLSEYSHAFTRSIAKPILDLLAAIPPVVYGVWGLLAIVPFVEDVLVPASKRWLSSISILAVNQPTGFSILAGGIVLAVMIAPLIISVVYEILRTVPEELRHASLAVWFRMSSPGWSLRLSWRLPAPWARRWLC